MRIGVLVSTTISTVTPAMFIPITDYRNGRLYHCSIPHIPLPLPRISRSYRSTTTVPITMQVSIADVWSHNRKGLAADCWQFDGR